MSELRRGVESLVVIIAVGHRKIVQESKQAMSTVVKGFIIKQEGWKSNNPGPCAQPRLVKTVGGASCLTLKCQQISRISLKQRILLVFSSFNHNPTLQFIIFILIWSGNANKFSWICCLIRIMIHIYMCSLTVIKLSGLGVMNWRIKGNCHNTTNWGFKGLFRII